MILFVTKQVEPYRRLEFSRKTPRWRQMVGVTVVTVLCLWLFISLVVENWGGP